MVTITPSAYSFAVQNSDGVTIYYNTETSTTCRVTSGDSKYSGSVNIPETVTYNGKEYSVTSIGSYAFNKCSDLTSVTIPNSVTKIYSDAFGYCSGLTSIDIPNSVTSIERNAFVYCSGLTSIDIPNSVNEIEDYTFSACSGLTSVTIPNSVTYIGSNAFQGCSSMTSLTIPESVTTIKSLAFDGCSGLTSVSLPNSVTSIGDGVFAGCTGLTSFYGKYATMDNRCLIDNKRLKAFAPKDLTEFTIPESVSNISSYTFSNYDGLKSVVITKNVNYINDYAFNKCNGLVSVIVDNDNPTNIRLRSEAFSKVPTSTCTLYVPKGSKALYAADDQWKVFKNIMEFDNIEEIGQESLTDGETYTATTDRVGVDVNYTRTFNNTEWQPLYVPFNMSYEEWSPYADVAEVHNVLGYDTDGNGEIDDIIIEFNKLNSGEIVPNVPYVIKAKNEGEVTFECTGKTLLAAPAEEGSVECSSTKMTYSFHGVYQPKTDMHTSGAYHLSGGAFHHTTTDEAVLPPNRFYMMVTPKTGGYNHASAPQMIRMKVDGEDVTTSIVGVEVDVQDDGIYYDMMGRKVVNPAQGIYIKNGKKVFVK